MLLQDTGHFRVSLSSSSPCGWQLVCLKQYIYIYTYTFLFACEKCTFMVSFPEEECHRVVSECLGGRLVYENNVHDSYKV